MKFRVKCAALAGACLLAPGLTMAGGIYVAPGLNGGDVPAPPFTQLNPNNGNPCYVGNTGCPSIGGGASGPVAPYVATPRGQVSVAVSGTAIGFTPPAGATYCYITVSTNAINYRTDGVNPTAAVGGGAALAVGPQLILSITSLSAYKAIAQTGTANEVADCYS